MNCPTCGNPIEGSSAFCTNCGAKLDGPNEAAPAQTDGAFDGESGYSDPAPVPAPAPKPASGGYVNAAAAVNQAQRQQRPHAPAKSRKRDMAPCRPISTWGFVWRTLLFMIPVLGLVLMFVFAFANGINENSRSYARSALILTLLFAIIVIAGAVLCYIYAPQITNWFAQLAENLQKLAH